MTGWALGDPRPARSDRPPGSSLKKEKFSFPPSSARLALLDSRTHLAADFACGVQRYFHRNGRTHSHDADDQARLQLRVTASCVRAAHAAVTLYQLNLFSRLGE
jgi:hypothetical protein